MWLSCPTFQGHLGLDLEVEKLKRVHEALRKVAAARTSLLHCLITAKVELARS